VWPRHFQAPSGLPLALFVVVLWAVIFVDAYEHDVVKKWTAEIAASDGFVLWET
jgi:hypothetical protein